MKTPFPSEPSEEFKRVLHNHRVVYHAFKDGKSLEECIVDMATQIEELTATVIHLNSIAPRVVKDKDGKLLRWDCPTEMLTPTKQP